MNKLLVAIKSCLKDRERGAHDAIRNTWGKDLRGADLKFFMGADTRFCFLYPEFLPFLSDEVFVNSLDDYENLPYKTREILRISLFHYDFTFLADTDSFILPEKLMRSGFEKYDIAARFGTTHPVGGPKFEYKDGRGDQGLVYPWPSGGLGYFLSRKAAQIVVDTEVKFWAEDLFVGQALGSHLESGELTGYDIPDYECNISWHWPRRATGKAYDPASGWQQKMYNEHK